MNVLPADLVAERLDAMDRTVPRNARIGLRPEHLYLTGADDALLSGRVVASEYTGAGSLLHVELSEGTVITGARAEHGR